MTYRGVVKNGVVVVEQPAKLPEGQPVEVVTIDPANGSQLPAYGIWADRGDVTDSGAESLRLRRAIEQRRE